MTNESLRRDEEEWQKWFAPYITSPFHWHPSGLIANEFYQTWKAALEIERARSAVLVDALEELRADALSEFWVRFVENKLKQYRGA